MPEGVARDTALILAAIALATTLSYAGSFSGTWVSDDVTMVAENPTIRALTPTNLHALVTSRTDGANYIPLNFLSLAIDYRLFGPRPWGFHLTNLLFHVANAAALFFLLARLGESHGIAAAVSLLWVLHPVQVESVAWISERKNVLSTFFLLLAFHAYLAHDERPTTGRYLTVVAWFAAALLSKVNTIVLPALLLCYEAIMRRRLRVVDVTRTLPLVACGLGVAWANLSGNPSHGAAYHGGSLVTTMRTSATTIPRYLENVVAPFDLMTYYPVPLRGSWLDPPVVGALLLIAAFAGLTCWLAARHRPEGFWLAWFGITLAPMLNLVPFPALMNDRYLYVPSIGALAVVVRQGARLLDAIGARRAGPPIVAATALGLALLTAKRVPVFHDELSLWADMGLRTSYITADEPYGAPPRNDQRRLLEGELARHPEHAWLHNNLGGFAFEENRLTDALPFLTRAYELDPSDPVIALNLGRTYLRLGRLDDALRALEVAVRLEPPSFFAHLNLARARLATNDVAGARAELALAKQLKSDPFFWRGFEQTLLRAEQRRS